MLSFTWLSFSALTLEELYTILQLRAAIFVVSQRCIYLDPDGRDQEAMHLLAREAGQLHAYLRLFPPTKTTKEVYFGRIVTADIHRGKGYGKQLMKTMLDYCEKHYPNCTISCSAQLYLQAFYESFGFKASGSPYDEDDIPHIHMDRVPA